MNKIIKNELEKVRATLPSYDDNTTSIFIPKKETISIDIKVNHLYRIMIEDYIINEPSNFTLSSNWNKGIKPTSKYLDVQITQVQGNMIQIDGCGIDMKTGTQQSDSYVGLWLPRKSITVIEEFS